jgi:serine/threonine protein kinase
MRHLRKVDWKIKMTWAAQIAHGLMEIHRVRVTHGDLPAENVVLDDKLDAKIIDIVPGWGFMFGWNPWRFSESEDMYKPHWDIYSLGVTLWEIATDGKTPPDSKNGLMYRRPSRRTSPYLWLHRLDIFESIWSIYIDYSLIYRPIDQFVMALSTYGRNRFAL